MDNTISKEFLIWLAGLTDGDGCFSIPISLRTSANNKQYINVSFQVRIGLKANDSWIINEIHDIIKVGKVYYSNKHTEEGVCYWQTTNWNDTIKVTELILPHLRLKKQKAVLFLEACKLFRGSCEGQGKFDKLNGPARDKDILLKVAKIATSLNYDRQTKRYRNYKNYEYWEKIINELYK